MIVTLLFFAGLMAVAAWWLVRQGLGTKPWLQTQPAAELAATGRPSLPTAKMGLGIFLAVAGLLLSLIVSAYVMRMDMADWQPRPAAAAALGEYRRPRRSAAPRCNGPAVAARRGNRGGVQDGLLAGGLTALLFLAGQLLAWRQLAGRRLPAGDQSGGGLLLPHHRGAWAARARRARRRSAGPGPGCGRGAGMAKLRAGVELCATYWHFLLLAWICLFALLAYAPSVTWLVALCSASFRLGSARCPTSHRPIRRTP